MVLLPVLLTNFVQAQGFLKVDTEKYIEWSDSLYLKWSDYQYRPNQTGKFKSNALTAVFHSVRGGVIKGKPEFQVKVLFVKEDSWTTDTLNIALLAHEKLHFDIAELYGRKIRKQIQAISKKGVSDMSEYRKYIRYFLNEFKKVSIIYDKETEHGNIPEEQARWFEFVSSELQRLHKYM